MDTVPCAEGGDAKLHVVHRGNAAEHEPLAFEIHGRLARVKHRVHARGLPMLDNPGPLSKELTLNP